MILGAFRRGGKDVTWEEVPTISPFYVTDDMQMLFETMKLNITKVIEVAAAKAPGQDIQPWALKASGAAMDSLGVRFRWPLATAILCALTKAANAQRKTSSVRETLRDTDWVNNVLADKLVELATAARARKKRARAETEEAEEKSTKQARQTTAAEVSQQPTDASLVFAVATAAGDAARDAVLAAFRARGVAV